MILTAFIKPNVQYDKRQLHSGVLPKLFALDTKGSDYIRTISAWFAPGCPSASEYG